MTYLAPPHLAGNELELLEDVLKSNSLAAGEYLKKFESLLAGYTGVKSALGLSSGSAALHLALRVGGVLQGDIVLASTFTFIGSVASACALKNELVFIDSDDSMNVDIELLQDAILKYKPKAFILTYLYGNTPKADLIAKICKENKVLLIEDSAEALGSFYKDKSAGSFGDFGVFSFNANKIITCAGGGALIAKDEENLQRARFYANQAREDLPFYEHKEYGYNYRLSNLNAALGVAGMGVLEKRVAKKREIFNFYKEALKEKFYFIDEREDARDNKWLSAAVLKEKGNFGKINEKIKQILNSLLKEDIEARMLWKPMHLQSVFKNNAKVLNKKSESFFQNGLCLPSGSELEREDLAKICEICLKNLKS